jgi:hypothetical protein
MRLRGLCEAFCLAGFLAAALAGCGDGGGIIITPDDPDEPDGDCTASTCGEVWVGLTGTGPGAGAGTAGGVAGGGALGAGGEFLSYAVDVVSIRLEKEGGGTVELLPERQRVDFVTVAGTAGLVAVAQVPEDDYVSATVRLDYGDAAVSVEVQGLPTGVVITDSAGIALGVVDMEVEFPDDGLLVADADAPALLSLGFDLAATHIVNPLVVPATAVVTGEPVWVATVGDAREFSASGLLVSVDESAGSYVADLRPLGDDSDDTDNGRATVVTDAATRFEVDGEVLARADALAAMSGLGADAWTSAVGAFDATAGTFTAREVFAGSSVAGAELDRVVGSVVSRTGNDLTLRGGVVVRTDETATFAPGDIRVRLGTDTVVSRDSEDTALDLDAVSVGQRVTALGEASSSVTEPVLDARSGRLRLHAVRVGGFVVSRTTGELRVELADFDGRDAGFFDFSGTGTSFAGDADPLNYQLDTGNFSLDEFAAGEPMQATGFIELFGEAPPDFVATSIVESSDLPALLGLGWGAGGTAAPFSLLSQSGFTVDAGNPGLGLARRFLERGPERLDVGQLGGALRVEPAASGSLLFAVVRDGRVESFAEFGDFVSRVSSLLGSGRNMVALTARGTYDEDERTLAAGYVAVTF